MRGTPRGRRLSGAGHARRAGDRAHGQGAPAPIDPQNWSWLDELTWNDYKQLPGPDYSDPSIQPTVKKWKVALVVTDFPGTPYTITQPRARRPSAPRPRRRTASRARTSRTSQGLLQHPAGAQPLPDDEPVLDGGFLRQVRRATGRLRPLRVARAASTSTSSTTGVNNARCPTPGDDAVQPQLPQRRARGVGGHRAGPDLHGRSRRPTTTSSTSPPARTSPRRGRSSAR